MIEELIKDGDIYAYVSYMKLDKNCCYSPNMTDKDLVLAYVDRIWVNPNERLDWKITRRIMYELTKAVSDKHPELTHCYFNRTKTGVLTHGTKLHDKRSIFRMLKEKEVI